MKDRLELMKSLPFTGEGVEIGVAGGFFSYHILAGMPLSQLYSIDPWSRPEAEPLDDAHTSSIKLYWETFRQLGEFRSRSTLLRCTSEEAAPQFADGQLDFVYIDGDHRYAAIKRDIELWFPKVRPGGFFGGHDYYVHTPGVIQAVDESGLPVLLTDCDEVNGGAPVRTWWIIKP